LGGDTLAATSSIISSVLSDGVTITGDGTTGSELTVDTTTVIATKGDLSDYVTVAGTQTITGAKTFSTDVEIDGKLDLNDGGNSVYIGDNAGSLDDATNNRNVGIGIDALESCGNCTRNVGIGYRSLQNNLNSFNVAIGYESLLSNTTGTFNVGLGYLALQTNTSGNNNLGIGGQSLQYSTTGSQNIALGFASLQNIISASNNSVVGVFAGRYFGDTSINVTKLDNSVLIGYDARPQLDSQFNQIVIGSEATGLGSNTAIIGNSSLTDIYNGADNANFSTVSDARDKKNIQPLQLGLNLIEKLNPVAFIWHKRDNTRVGVKDIGFIAQEFDGALYALPHSDYADFVKITSDGNWKLNLSDIYPVIIKAIQEQQAIIESQATEIETLKTLITELSNRLQILENN